MNWQSGNYSKKTDEELMKLIGSGKTAAFDELYARYSKRLLFYFYKMLGYDEAKAQDLMHDLFVQIIERPHQFDPNRRFSTWIFSVAHNRCKNEYRKKGIYSLDERIDLPDHQVIESLENEHAQLFQQHLERALEELNDVQKAVFLLRHREQLSLAEIAEIMDCSEGTVKSRLFYACKKLAVFLQEFKY